MSETLKSSGVLTMTRHRESLLEYMQGLDVYDCHTHIRPEAWRLKWPVDAMTLIATYPIIDAISSQGPVLKNDSGEYLNHQYFTNAKIPLEERWKHFEPLLENARFGSFFRASKIALREIYGFDELNSRNVHEVSNRIRESNQPGFYHEILSRRCRIKKSLVQCSGTHMDDLAPRPLLTPIYSGPTCYKHNFSPFVETLNKKYEIRITRLDEYLEALSRHLREKKDQGTVGLKVYSWDKWLYLNPDPAGAEREFAEMLAGAPGQPLLEATVKDHLFRLAAEMDWTISMHGGGSYMDFRLYEPRRIIDVITRHPDTRFDIFHLGIPFTSEIVGLAKQYPNTTLNLNWAYALSESITRSAIHEIIETVPVNKVIAYGSDVMEDIEAAYGHLVMTREVIAEALAERIERGRLDMEGARRIAKLWFHDNPERIYGLG
jgi:hypothetical protein